MAGQNDLHFLIDPAENAFSPSIATGRRGTVITVDVADPDIATVVQNGYDRLVLERSDDSGLTWREITAPSQRPVLSSEVESYRVIDRHGDPDFRYRTRYLDVKTGELSEPSEDIAGEGLAALGILSVEQLKKRYFFGVDLTNDRGEQLGDDVFQHYILAAVRWLEHQIDVPIAPTSFVDEHDYHREDYAAFNFLQLDNYPLISVEAFRANYPSGQSTITYPAEWLRINYEHGQIQVVPTAGTMSEVLIGQGGSYLPGVFNGQHFLPHLFEVEYTAGFARGRVPRDIVDVIGMFASLGPFNIFGDLIAGAGIATMSLSMDGLSQSIGTTSSATNSGYGSRVIQYLKQIREQIKNLQRYYKGIRLVSA